MCSLDTSEVRLHQRRGGVFAPEGVPVDRAAGHPALRVSDGQPRELQELPVEGPQKRQDQAGGQDHGGGRLAR